MSIKIASLALASGLLLASQPALASRPLALAIGQQVRGEITAFIPKHEAQAARHALCEPVSQPPEKFVSLGGPKKEVMRTFAALTAASSANIASSGGAMR